jgi:hypothetical protein
MLFRSVKIRVYRYPIALEILPRGAWGQDVDDEVGCFTDIRCADDAGALLARKQDIGREAPLCPSVDLACRALTPDYWTEFQFFSLNMPFVI